MGVVESNSAAGQLIDVRRLGLGVPSQTTNPVIEVVDGDEQDVGFLDRHSKWSKRLQENHRRHQASKKVTKWIRHKGFSNAIGGSIPAKWTVAEFLIVGEKLTSLVVAWFGIQSKKLLSIAIRIFLKFT